ncbi:peptidylprolyl isomerase [uncultured Sunxiuqinia sp.]|uniref:peptidylprolyl isomerase n=1 Tax=uncultured Sunxiuqinia sp. TaxID=1573825 RepID=UPI002628D6C2|nr:peptidylprolyl isomerase [uncultured Sunxiuqinia sp.]
MKPGLLSLLLICFYACNRPAVPTVIIETERGNVVVELYPEKAPVTVANFLRLVEDQTYSGACFYRVVRMDNQPDNDVKIEVIQGGLKEDELVEKYPAIMHETTRETGLKHQDGTLSMARMEPGTASTEFFICVGEQPELDFGGQRNPDGQGFAAFGKVVQGMEVVREIQQGNDDGQLLQRPIRIIGMTLEK